MLNKNEIIDHIANLATKARQIALDKLTAAREEKGYQAFIFDLKHIEKVEPTWSVKKGLLTIQLPASHTTLIHVNGFLDEQLGSKPWYSSSRDFNPSTVTLNDTAHPDGFKVLGRYGRNSAVDPTLFITSPTDPLRVLAIIRNDGSGVRALPGGMMPDNVMVRCIEELLEECFRITF